MKTNVGERGQYGVRVTVHKEGEPSRVIPPCSHSRCRWPYGFEWTCVGFGPVQLALALLADHLGDGQGCLEFYQDFTREVVADLPLASRIAFFLGGHSTLGPG